MALFIKNFRRVFRKGNFRNYGKNKGKNKGNSLKTNDNILLEIRELLTSENEKVNDLTKKYSLVEDTNANLRSENA